MRYLSTRSQVQAQTWVLLSRPLRLRLATFEGFGFRGLGVRV